MLPSKHKTTLPSKNAIVVKSNQLIEASYNLSIQQLRLIHWLSRVVQEDDTDYKYYDIDVPLFLQFLNLKGSNSSRDRIREVTKQLQQRTILIRTNDDEWEQFSWLRYSKIFRKENRLILRLSINPEMLPFIKGLKSTFTKTPFYQITAFKTRYGWRFYEWFKQFEDTGWFIISVPELRSRLHFGETEYIRFNNLRQRVINPALKEICAVSDLDVTLVKLEKKGRSIHKLKFKILSKKSHVIPMEKSTVTNEETLILDRLVSYGMPEKEALKNVQRFYQIDREHLLNCLADIEQKIESGFTFKEDKPLIWLRYLLKTDPREQPSLFIRSINKKLPVDPKVLKEQAEKRIIGERINYLETTLTATDQQYLKARRENIAKCLSNIPDLEKQTWKEKFSKQVSPSLQQFLRSDGFWVHRLFLKDIEVFISEHGQQVLNERDFDTQIGFDRSNLEGELHKLRENSF